MADITLKELFDLGGLVVLVVILLWFALNQWRKNEALQQARLDDYKEWSAKLMKVAEDSADYMKEISSKIEASKRRDE